MVSQRTANIAFNILLLVAVGIFALEAESFKTSGLLASTGLPSKFFPQLILAFLGLCSVIVIGAYVFKGYAGTDEGASVFEDGGEARRGLLVLVVAIGCYLIWALWSFIPMLIIIGPACALAMGVRSIWMYISLLIMSGVVFLIFTELLNVRFI